MCIRDSAKTWLKEHKEAADQIEKAIRDQAGVGAVAGGAGIDLLDEDKSIDE